MSAVASCIYARLPAPVCGFARLADIGEVSEWFKVPLSKSGVRKHRGFESRPLRHSHPADLGGRDSR
jgi:hypothetical protein